MKKNLFLGLVVLCQTAIANDLQAGINRISDPQTRGAVTNILGNLGGIVFGSPQRVRAVQAEKLSIGECFGIVKDKKQNFTDFEYAGTIGGGLFADGKAEDYYSYDDARRKGILSSDDDSMAFLLKRGLSRPKFLKWASVPNDRPPHSTVECSNYFYLGKIDKVINGDDTCRRVEFFIEAHNIETKEDLSESYHMLFCPNTRQVYADYGNFDFEVLEVIQESEKFY